MRHELAPRRSFGARAARFWSALGAWVLACCSVVAGFFRALVAWLSEMPSSLLGAAAPASASASALQEALENAGRLIDRQLQEDRMYPDLSELLLVSAPSE